VTPGSDALLLDTCAIINLSYCSPVATLFQNRYKGRGGWTEAVRTELTRQRTRKPPHPQAGRACNWAKGWLGRPLTVLDEPGQIAVAEIQEAIAVLRTHRRMRVRLTPIDLFAGDLRSWA